MKINNSRKNVESIMDNQGFSDVRIRHMDCDDSMEISQKFITKKGKIRKNALNGVMKKAHKNSKKFREKRRNQRKEAV